jgi:hypothetical protein
MPLHARGSVEDGFGVSGENDIHSPSLAACVHFATTARRARRYSRSNLSDLGASKDW